MTHKTPGIVFGAFDRSWVAVLRVVVCLSSLCVGSGSRVCPVRGLQRLLFIVWSGVLGVEMKTLPVKTNRVPHVAANFWQRFVR